MASSRSYWAPATRRAYAADLRAFAAWYGGERALEQVDVRVLADYTGTIVHDGWAPYEHFDGASHAQCHAHLIRHLGAVGETPAFAGWCADMIGVLLDAKHASEAAAAGFDGLRWWVRHDPAQRLVGIALFGPAGASAPSVPLPSGVTGPLDSRLLEEARGKFGCSVLPRP